MTAADSDDPQVTAYIDRLQKSYGKEIAGLGPSVFTYGYYTAGQAMIKPRGCQRRHLRSEEAARRPGEGDALG
jgi:hypothetical protein